MPATRIRSSTQALRVVTLTSSSNSTAINSDNTEIGVLTLSENTTFQNPSGTPTDGQLLQVRITSSVSRTLSTGTAYGVASGLSFPLATTGGGVEDYIAWRYSSSATKWIMVATTIGVLANASSALDAISSTQGTILYRGASAWVALATGTSGQVLSTGGIGANPSWIDADGGWSTIRKGSDEDRISNTTNTADAALVTPTLAANKTYSLEMFLIVTGTAATGGIKAQFDIPSGASLAGNWSNSTATANVNQPTNASVTIATAANQDPLQTHYFKGAIILGGTAGTVTFSWSQVTSAANAVTVKAGSELKYKLGN